MASSDVVSWVLGHSPADWLSQTELATLPESSEISGEPGTPSWWDDDESQEGESFLSRLGRDFVHCLDWVSGFEFLQDRLGVVLSLGILLSLEESFFTDLFSDFDLDGSVAALLWSGLSDLLSDFTRFSTERQLFDELVSVESFEFSEKSAGFRFLSFADTDFPAFGFSEIYKKINKIRIKTYQIKPMFYYLW